VKLTKGQLRSGISARLPRNSRAAIALLLALMPVAALAQDSAAGPEASGFAWRDRPSLQFGDLRIDLRLKVAHDWRRFDPEVDASHSDWRMRRGGVNGELGDHLEFEIERDLFAGGDWRDIFLNWRTYSQLGVKGGRFKVPFGREQNVSTSAIDFAERALVSNRIPPARARGVMAHGRLLQRRLSYELGVFVDDGDNARPPEDQLPRAATADAGPSFAARVTAAPFSGVAAVETLRAAFAWGGASVPEGLNSLWGQTVHETHVFFEPVFVKGGRTRAGFELAYAPGPFGVTAELMQARDERRGQGAGGVDLSDVVATGWYASATWLVTGEDKEGFEEPRRRLFGGGIGAVEIALRLERLGFESAAKPGVALRDARAAHLAANSNRVLTFGLNWFPNRWVRATLNGIREAFADPARTPMPGETTFWSGLTRLQLVF
jgi:phosphate-selective porin OprO/OprP